MSEFETSPTSSNKTKKKTKPRPWTIEDSRALYKVNRWGDGYFDINKQGHLCVVPEKSDDAPRIDIAEVVEEMRNAGIQFPAVIRFHDVLRSQVQLINRIFLKTIDEAKFKGTYMGVYPIKVNQLREVVEEIMDAGAPFNYGLEAGSKAELLAVLAMNTNTSALTVLNGYKDRDYLKLALMGRKLGRKMIVVIEKFSELPDLIALADEMDVEPMIGIRAKLASQGSGKWANSCGDNAKFGLTIPEILQAVEFLKEHNHKKNLKLLHFHLGSQITDIRTIKESITEAARIYAKLVKLGLPIEYFDVGGGVGVDYEGTKSTHNSSMNYALADYAGDVVYILKQICDLEDVDHPNIVTETGRAITAYHSCIVMNVFGSVKIANDRLSTEKTSGEHVLVTNMRELHDYLKPSNYLDVYNDAVSKREECISAFKLGILDLDERAKIEGLYWKICRKVATVSLSDKHAPEEIQGIRAKMADQYLCNLSVFQSIPDTWAIGQHVPIVPIMRLNERPTRVGTIADITCDSDGKINHFPTEVEDGAVLPLHEIKRNETYIIGAFLTGAYQDILGDVHNLFGRLNEVHVFCDDDDPSDFYIEEVIAGNTCEQVLAMLQYSPLAMAQVIKRALDKQVQKGKLRPREGVALTDFYERCLKSYTYLNK